MIPAPKAGTTLLEVLLAVTIFSLFVVTIFLSVSSLAMVQVKSQQKSEATRIAQELLEISYNLSLSWPLDITLGQPYSLVFNPANQYYSLQSGTDTSNSPFESSVTFHEVKRNSNYQLDPSGTVDPNSLWVYATVTWSQSSNTQSVTLSNLLINPLPKP